MSFKSETRTFEIFTTEKTGHDEYHSRVSHVFQIYSLQARHPHLRDRDKKYSRHKLYTCLEKGNPSSHHCWSKLMQLDIGKWLNLFLSLPLQLVLIGLSLKFISTRSKLILRDRNLWSWKRFQPYLKFQTLRPIDQANLPAMQVIACRVTGRVAPG